METGADGASHSPAAALLQLARMDAGLTQQGLAERAGVNRSVIAAYEQGRRDPTLATLLRMLKAAGFELRLHLAPYDDHDEVLAAKRDGWSAEHRQAWNQRHADRIERGQAALARAARSQRAKSGWQTRRARRGASA